MNFQVFEAGDVIFKLFDVTGNLLGKKLYPQLNPDKYEIDMNLDDLDSGIYLYRLVLSGTKTKVKKILLIR